MRCGTGSLLLSLSLSLSYFRDHLEVVALLRYIIVSFIFTAYEKVNIPESRSSMSAFILTLVRAGGWEVAGQVTAGGCGGGCSKSQNRVGCKGNAINFG